MKTQLKDKKQILRRKKAYLNLFKHLSLPTPKNLNFPDNEIQTGHNYLNEKIQYDPENTET